MALDSATAIAQIDACLADFDALRRQATYDDISGNVTNDERRAAITRCLAAIHRLSPANGPYVAQVQAVVGHDGHVLLGLAGILQALRADYEAGYMQAIEVLIHAAVFADFLEMADELQTKGFKDPAAVLAGSVLEEHLRKLAATVGVVVEKADGTPKKADTLNADLAKVPAYTKIVQKQVTYWLGIRNAAAHAKYDEYDDGQVAALIRDVRDFLDRHPA